MEKCPKCGENLEYDEVDIGVGIIQGNPGCPNCFWTPPKLNENIRDYKFDEPLEDKKEE